MKDIVYLLSDLNYEHIAEFTQTCAENTLATSPHWGHFFTHYTLHYLPTDSPIYQAYLFTCIPATSKYLLAVHINEYIVYCVKSLSPYHYLCSDVFSQTNGVAFSVHLNHMWTFQR